MNFRISGRYGKEFRQSGYKQTGRKARDDVEDGVHYTIVQGWTDKSKAAICGQDQETAFRGSGANDPKVNINESDQIIKALREKGFEVRYMVKYDEGHEFRKEHNRIGFYKAMLGFFAQNFNTYK